MMSMTFSAAALRLSLAISRGFHHGISTAAIGCLAQSK